MDPNSSRMTLQEVFDTISRLTGLEVSVYPPLAGAATPAVEKLPMSYRRHMSDFCRCVKNNRSGRGCGGHDASYTNNRAVEVGCPFVQVCHAGVAEVIVPIFGERQRHLATVFVGQVVTEQVEAEGIEGVFSRVAGRGVNKNIISKAFENMPRMKEQDLLRIGQLLESAVYGLIAQMDMESFEQEVGLQNNPAIRMALDIIRKERQFDIKESEIAQRVYVSAAHFSRLFHKVMGRRFSEYLEELRINEAQKMLHHSDLPVGEIASRCGYSRQSYFTRCFRRVTGMTPRAYRRYRSESAAS